MAAGRSAAYTYDALGRLSTAATTGPSPAAWSMTESYDQFGNLWSQTGTNIPTISLTYGTQGMNSSTNNQPNGFTYDASGNMTVEPSSLVPLLSTNYYAYDAENRQVLMQSGSAPTQCSTAQVCYTYDGNGRRIEEAVQGQPTMVYVYSGPKVIAEYSVTNSASTLVNEYIYGSGETLLAGVSGSTTEYFHQDHLSVRAVSNSSGSIVYQQGTYPFGEMWYQGSGPTEWLFTTYQHDPQSGLDYALARNYDSRVPGFGSPDPLPGSQDDPQSWNRYAYVRNDPVDMTDPSGQSWLTDLLNFVLGAVYKNHNLWGMPGQPPPFGMPGGPSNGTIWNEHPPVALGGGGVPSWAIIKNLLDANAGVGATDQDTSGGYLITLRILSIEILDDGGCTDGSFLCNGLRQDPGALRSLHMAGNMLNSGKFYGYWFGASAIVGGGGAAVVDLAAGPEESVLFGRFSPVNGGFSGYLNSNDFLRIGYGWNEELGQNVFRIGGDALKYVMDNPHIDLWPPSSWF